MKARFVRGSSWTAIGLAADNLIQFVIFAILARLLSLPEVGLAAFALVFIDFGRVFVYGGLPEAMVRAPVWDQRVASVCFSTNLVYAAIFALLLSLIGGPLMEQYYAPGSWGVVSALSLVLVIDAARAIHVAKLRREFRYRNLAIRGTIGGTISGAIAVALALAGAGVWALVAQRLGVALILTLTTWASANFRPQLVLSRAVVAELAGFSRRATLVRLLDIGNMRITDVLVGFLLGPAAVAIYRVGGRGLDAITQLIIRPFQDAAFSAFSRVGDPAAIGRALLRVIHAGAALICPVFIGAAIVATEVTVLVFGEKYSESGAVMAALALGGMPVALALFTTSAFLTAADGRVALRTNLAGSVSNLALSAVGAPFGAVGAAIGNCAAQFLAAPYRLAWVRREFALPASAVLAAVRVPVLAASGMALILLLLKHWLLGGLHPFPRLAVLVVAGGCLYPMLLLLAGRHYVAALTKEMIPLMPKGLVSRFRRT